MVTMIDENHVISVIETDSAHDVKLIVGVLNLLKGFAQVSGIEYHDLFTLGCDVNEAMQINFDACRPVPNWDLGNPLTTISRPDTSNASLIFCDQYPVVSIINGNISGIFGSKIGSDHPNKHTT